MSKIKTHTFMGRKYHIYFQEDAHGLCDTTDTTSREMIIFDKEEDSREYLDTMIHESLHACGLRRENQVKPMARDIARILWRQGWRLKK